MKEINTVFKKLYFFEFKNERNYKGLNILFNSQESLDGFLEILNKIKERNICKVLITVKSPLVKDITSKICQNLTESKIQTYKKLYISRKTDECTISIDGVKINLIINFDSVSKMINVLNKLKDKKVIEIGIECKNDIIIFWYF